MKGIAAATGVAVGILAFGAGAARADGATCPPLTQGYWKNHPSKWKLTTITLGTTPYTQVQSLQILGTPPNGDASLILADQLIAAQLDIADGTDGSQVASTIADANKLLGVGPIPEGIASSSTLGQQMVADAGVLNTFDNGGLTQACGVPVPTGYCQPSSSLSALQSGTNVISYVPKGHWGGSSAATGVSVINVEGTSISPTLIATPDVVNSCASNSTTGVTVCTANGNDVYLLSGTSISSTLTSGGLGFMGFSGGSCRTCGVAMDAVNNKAVIGLSIDDTDAPGFQILDLATSTFGIPFKSPAGKISEGPLIIPVAPSSGAYPPGATLPLLLSASELNIYEIAANAESTTPAFFENPIPNSAALADSSAADCSAGIALAPHETNIGPESSVFIGDLTQATFTPGTWTAPSQVQTLTESFLQFGASAIAVAQGTHTGILSGEFGGDALTAIALPATSGSGTPAIGDWVTCNIGGGFDNGNDPHTVTAYKSPANGHAIALLANRSGTSATATEVAKVDLTAMLDPTIVPRTTGAGAGHACLTTPLPATVVIFIPVP